MMGPQPYWHPSTHPYRFKFEGLGYDLRTLTDPSGLHDVEGLGRLQLVVWACVSRRSFRVMILIGLGFSSLVEGLAHWFKV